MRFWQQWYYGFIDIIVQINRDLMRIIKMNEFNEYVRESFSEFGDIVIKPMMGGYLVSTEMHVLIGGE